MTGGMSSAEIRQVERAQQVLLSPFEYPDVDDWRLAVNRALRPLVGADSAGFLLPVVDGLPLLSEEHDPAALALFPELLPPPLSDGTSCWERTLSLGVCTIRTAYGPDVERYYASPYLNEYAGPNGARDAASVSFSLGGDTPWGAASVQFWKEHEGGPHAFGERELGILRAVFPAFRAGVEMQLRFASVRRDLFALLDGLAKAVLVCDPLGRVVHETPALARELELDADREALRLAMLDAGQAVWRPMEQSGAVARGVRTPQARYEVHACSAGSLGGPQRLSVVSLERRSARRRTSEEMRVEFGLTPAQARVAVLLGEGRGNAEVARLLGISPFTARRHTERVLLKLGVRTRAEVATRLYY